VTSPASVSRDERLRLFLGLRLPDPVVDVLAAWQERELSAGRVVPPGNLHVTLAFLGGRPAAELPSIVAVLEREAAAAGVPSLELAGYRETRSVGMLTLRDETGAAAELAGRLHEALAALGVYRPEARPWLPHVTVLRFRERPRLRPTLPELEPFAPSDAAAFLSRLHPSGARYQVLESFRLGG
jgi:RNA 2',3'-cyclic 3'-phosphodiesterase